MYHRSRSKDKTKEEWTGTWTGIHSVVPVPLLYYLVLLAKTVHVKHPSHYHRAGKERIDFCLGDNNLITRTEREQLPSPVAQLKWKSTPNVPSPHGSVGTCTSYGHAQASPKYSSSKTYPLSQKMNKGNTEPPAS